MIKRIFLLALPVILAFTGPAVPCENPEPETHLFAHPEHFCDTQVAVDMDKAAFRDVLAALCGQIDADLVTTPFSPIHPTLMPGEQVYRSDTFYGSPLGTVTIRTQDSFEKILGMLMQATSLDFLWGQAHGDKKATLYVGSIEEMRAAVNQAGHAVVNFHGGHWRMLEISIFSVDEYNGHMVMAFNPSNPTVYEEAISGLETLLAGDIAEETYFGDLVTGWSDDEEKARALAELVIGRFGLRDENGNYVWPSRTEPNREFLVQQLIVQCSEAATQILAEHRDKLELVATTLLRDQVMNGDEILELLQDSGE